MTPFLSIRGISKEYAGQLAVDHVNLEVAEGEFLTFLGPSGSGKSTLLYMIAGIQSASSGEITLSGRSLLDVVPNKRNIGMVFQRYTLFPNMAIDDNIAFPLRIRGWTQERVEARVAEMMELVHLTAFRGRMPAHLSGGQQQRVALARALSYHPRILLMDEPLAALDKKLKEEIQVELRRIHRATGVTILYVTHDQEEAIRLADRIAVFNKGRIEQVASPEELYERPASHFVAGFVGNSNFLQATAETAATARLPNGKPVAIRTDGDLTSGDDVSLLLRPELITFSAFRPELAEGLAVTVLDVAYLGEIFDVSVETEWGDLVSARIAKAHFAEAGLLVGGQATLHWPEGGLIAFPAARSPR
jgi:putative spermidine/putrescine transport system ATP-binding protein